MARPYLLEKGDDWRTYIYHGEEFTIYQRVVRINSTLTRTWLCHGQPEGSIAEARDRGCAVIMGRILSAS